MAVATRPSDELGRNHERLQTLNEISRVVAATLDLQALYETIYEQIGRVMDASQFFIALYQPGHSSLLVPYLREEGRLSLNETTDLGDTVTSRVIQRGETFVYRTGAEYEEYEQRNGLTEGYVGEESSESGIFVPLNTGSRTIGALTVQSSRPHAYTDEDMGMLTVIASQAAVAIENARLFEQSRQTVLQTQALLRLAHTISGVLDLQEVLDAILRGLHEVMPFYLASVLLPDRSGQYLDIVRTVDPSNQMHRTFVRIPLSQGLTGHVFHSGEPLLVGDVRSDPRYVSGDWHNVRSELVVPLRRGDAIIGVLNVEREHVHAFNEDDLNLLSLFASQAAIAIENARLFRELQSRISDLQMIQSVVQQLTPVHDIAGIATVINRELRRLIPYHSWRMFVVDPSDQTLIPVSVEGVPIGNRRLAPREGITGWIAEHGTSVLINDTMTDPRSEHIAGTPDRPESMIGAPLIYGGSVRGVITLSQLGTHQFDSSALRLLEIVAAQMAIAFDRARLYEELREEAITDALTGLYNRRYLAERLSEERARAIRNHHTLAAMMVDIDTFKRINDTYGHDAGDLVLQQLAGIIQSTVRAEDIVARYGGEEFCIVLPEIAAEPLMQLGARLRAAIEAFHMPPATGVSHITVSIGIALLSAQDAGPELFATADRAMYRVKHEGGNGVCLDDGTGMYMVD